MTENAVTESKRTLKQKAYEEFKEFLGIAFYLWMVFSVMLLYKSALLSEQGSFIGHGIAIINALALGKIMLIAQHFNFAENFRERPLIYPTIFKSIAFAIILGIFKVLEEAGIGWYHGKSFAESIGDIGGGTLRGILALMAVLAILLIPFFGLRELGSVFGREKIARLFFTSRHLSDTPS
jgi:hypothetical protein